jgi:hypothetical protein
MMSLAVAGITSPAAFPEDVDVYKVGYTESPSFSTST